MGAKQRIDQLEMDIKLLSEQIERLAPMEALLKDLSGILDGTDIMYTQCGQRIWFPVGGAIKAALQRARQ